MINTNLLYALSDCQDIRSSHGVIRLKCRECGYLLLPTGRIVSGDALFLRDQKPFDFKVNRDRAKVVASLADSDDSPVKVAFVSLCLADSRPVAWRPAKPKGFRGDNAIAAMGDAASVKAWDEYVDSEGEQQAWKRLRDSVARDHLCPVAVFPIPHADDFNLMVWDNSGDCFGRAYYGLNDQGDVVSLSIDTGLLERLIS